MCGLHSTWEFKSIKIEEAFWGWRFYIFLRLLKSMFHRFDKKESTFSPFHSPSTCTATVGGN